MGNVLLSMPIEKWLFAGVKYLYYLFTFKKMEKFKELVKRNGQVNFAKKLNVSQPTLQAWLTNKRPIPVKRCVQIEKLTGGVVTRKDLRPDDWREIWIELAEKEAAENSGSLKD